MEIVVIILLGLIAATVVAYPLISDGAASGPSDAVLDAQIDRYRQALRAGTVCERCEQANPPGSRYCSECGRALSLAADHQSPEPSTDHQSPEHSGVDE